MSHLYLQPLCNLPGSRSPAGLHHTTLGSWLSSGQNQSSFLQAQQAPWHHLCLCQPNTPCSLYPSWKGCGRIQFTGCSIKCESCPSLACTRAGNMRIGRSHLTKFQCHLNLQPLCNLPSTTNLAELPAAEPRQNLPSAGSRVHHSFRRALREVACPFLEVWQAKVKYNLRNTLSQLHLQPLCNSASPAEQQPTLRSWLSTRHSQSSFLQAEQALWRHVRPCQPNTSCSLYPSFTGCSIKCESCPSLACTRAGNMRIGRSHLTKFQCHLNLQPLCNLPSTTNLAELLAAEPRQNLPSAGSRVHHSFRRALGEVACPFLEVWQAKVNYNLKNTLSHLHL